MSKPLVSSHQLPPGEPEFTTSEGSVWLDRLTEVNVLIGPNNSGKSQLLRRLFKTFMTLHRSAPVGANRFETMSRLSKLAQNLCTRSSAANTIALKHIFEGRMTGADEWVCAPFKDIDEFLMRFFSEITERSGSGKARSEINEFRDWHNSLSVSPPYTGIVQCVYIPALRTARTDLSERMDSTSKPYFTGPHEPRRGAGPGLAVDISTWAGEHLHRRLKQSLLGDLLAREKVRAFEEFLRSGFFDGQRVTLVPKEVDQPFDSIDDSYQPPTRSLAVKVGEEKEWSILELGDGIQQVILMTWPIFEHMDQPLALFIEEPELYLHPGMQQKLLDVLINGAPQTKDLQVFLATHSHTFLDRTFDENKVSVFRLSKSLHGEDKDQRIAKFQTRRLAGPDFSLLHELGVTNSSVMLANSTIWVEGITDRMYVRKWLKLLLESKKEQLTEDIHYAFMEYGGGNITHWSFLDAVEANGLDGVAKENRRINVDALCAELFLIADSDGAEPDSEKARRLLQLKAKLGNRFAQHDSVEVENLLTRDCILATLQRLGRDVSGAPNFSQSDYSNMRLGKFIVEVIMAGKKMPDSFQLKSGSINKKVDFATEAMNCMGAWDDLSAEAQVLTEKVYGFIRSKNPR